MIRDLRRSIRERYIRWRYGTPPKCARFDQDAEYVHEADTLRDRPLCFDHAASATFHFGLENIRDVDPREDYEKDA